MARVIKKISELKYNPRVTFGKDIAEKLEVETEAELTAKVDAAIEKTFGVKVDRTRKSDSKDKAIERLAKEYGKTSEEVEKLLSGED